MFSLYKVVIADNGLKIEYIGAVRKNRKEVIEKYKSNIKDTTMRTSKNSLIYETDFYSLDEFVDEL